MADLINSRRYPFSDMIALDYDDKERMAELVGNIIRAVFNETPRYSFNDQYGNALYAAVLVEGINYYICTFNEQDET